MKNLILSSALCLICSVFSFARAEENLFRAFAQKAASSVVSVDYSYSALLSGVRTEGEGSVTVQGTAYRNTCSGIDVYCDGTSVWTVDMDSREMVVESAEDNSSSYFADPAVLLVNISDAFKVSSEKKTGDGLYEYHLLPVSQCGLKECTIFLKGKADNPVPVKARIISVDGVRVDLEFSSVSYSTQMMPLSSFRPVEPGSGWVVTDLR